MTRKEKELALALHIEQRIRQCRKTFWTFCQTLHPAFYRDDRPHLKRLCDTLQNFYLGLLVRSDGERYMKLMINEPRRFGKTRTLILFCAWILGINHAERIIACSYNEEVAIPFSRHTRDIIQERKNLPQQIVYSDIFPDSKIKHGDASVREWSLEGEFFSYKGTGVDGTITGKGATLLLEDDLIKNDKIAFDENALDKIWNFRIGTLLQAKESSAIEIINMTRWGIGDPHGRLEESGEIENWYVLKEEAKNLETGELLCPALLSESEYQEKKIYMIPEIFWANYHQRAVDIEGRLYKNLKTYTEYPKDDEGKVVFERIINYTDTADEGKDYLVSLTAGQYHGQAWLLDVYMTLDGMEVTEPETAKHLNENNVGLAKIESNNGGRGFARNVGRILEEHVKAESDRIEKAKGNGGDFTEEDRTWRRIAIKWFHQSENKRARIMTSSSFVINNIYFPVNSKERWPVFWKAITDYQKEGKNKHDDAPDALTGLAEMVNTSRPRARLV